MAQNQDVPTMHAPILGTSVETIVKSMSALGNQLTLAQTIGRKNHFDGLSGEKFAKWIAEVDDIYL